MYIAYTYGMYTGIWCIMYIAYTYGMYTGIWCIMSWDPLASPLIKPEERPLEEAVRKRNYVFSTGRASGPTTKRSTEPRQHYTTQDYYNSYSYFYFSEALLT